MISRLIHLIGFISFHFISIQFSSVQFLLMKSIKYNQFPKSLIRRKQVGVTNSSIIMESKSFRFKSGLVLSILFVIHAKQLNGEQEVPAKSLDFNKAAQLFTTARELFNNLPQEQNLSALYPNQDPRTQHLLRDSILRVTQLINNYRQNGLSNLPSLPNLPGLNTVMTVPDKLLRAELSMLQDEIRMAQDMMQNPISATMNIPKDLANMLARMAEQLEQ